MELYQLRSFAAVAEFAHLTRAAEKLHISQPAVSAQIKALEDELGVVLFERTPSGMVLTSAGRKLLPEAEKVIAAAQVLRSRARAIKGEVSGRVRVGTVSDPGFVRVGDFLAQAEPREGFVQRFLAAIDGWFYRQQMDEREAYLAQSQDIFDLERRLRQLDRRSCI